MLVGTEVITNREEVARVELELDEAGARGGIGRLPPPPRPPSRAPPCGPSPLPRPTGAGGAPSPVPQPRPPSAEPRAHRPEPAPPPQRRTPEPPMPRPIVRAGARPLPPREGQPMPPSTLRLLGLLRDDLGDPRQAALADREARNRAEIVRLQGAVAACVGVPRPQEPTAAEAPGAGGILWSCRDVASASCCVVKGGGKGDGQTRGEGSAHPRGVGHSMGRLENCSRKKRGGGDSFCARWPGADSHGTQRSE